MKCVRCQKTESEEWYDAHYFTKELSSENIVHTPGDDLCLACGHGYMDMHTAEVRARVAHEAEERKKRDESRPIPLRSLTYLQETWCTFPANLPRKLSQEQKNEMFQRIQAVVNEYCKLI